MILSCRCDKMITNRVLLVNVDNNYYVTNMVTQEKIATVLFHVVRICT